MNASFYTSLPQYKSIRVILCVNPSEYMRMFFIGFYMYAIGTCQIITDPMHPAMYIHSKTPQTKSQHNRDTNSVISNSYE